MIFLFCIRWGFLIGGLCFLLAALLGMHLPAGYVNAGLDAFTGACLLAGSTLARDRMDTLPFSRFARSAACTDSNEA